MEEDFEIQTVSSAMETMSDKDLAFIAAYNPKAMHSLCTMWTLELQLKKEGKQITTADEFLRGNEIKIGQTLN